MERLPDRVRRRLGALAPAAHLLELTRAGLRSSSARTPVAPTGTSATSAATGTIEERDAIARRGWDRFVEGVREALPLPHAPLTALDRLARFDRLTIAERIEELDLDEEERDVLAAELESVAHGPLDEAGAVSILRWHALSGYSLELTQFTGGRVTIDGGHRRAAGRDRGRRGVRAAAGTPVAAVSRRDGQVEVHTRDGEVFAAARRSSPWR